MKSPIDLEETFSGKNVIFEQKVYFLKNKNEIKSEKY